MSVPLSRFVALLLAAGSLLAIGCEHTVYEVDLSPRGDKLHRELTVWKQGQENESPKAIDGAELNRLAQLYGQDPPAAMKGKYSFGGDFARRTPRDVGGSGWYTRWESPFGVVTAYLEQFRGRDDMAEEIKHRQEIAGRMVDFFRDWLTQEVGDDPRAAKVRAFLDGEFRHDIENLVLYCWVYEVSQTSPDKTRAEELGMRLLAYFAERGYVSPDSLPVRTAFQGQEGPSQAVDLMLRIVAAKSGIAATEGWPAGLEKLKDYDTLHRSLMKAVHASDLPALADKIAREEQTIVVRNKDENEEQKADGTMMVLLLQVVAPTLRFTSDELRLRYHSARPPLSTNGNWNEETKTVSWNGTLSPDDKPRQPPYTVYAAWATANEEAQTARFGKVVLRDQPLAEYCLWYNGLTAAERREWDAYLATFQPGDKHRDLLLKFRLTGEDKRSPDRSNMTPVSGRGRDILLQVL